MEDNEINGIVILEKLNLLLEKQKRFEEELSTLNKELESIKRTLPNSLKQPDQKPVTLITEVKEPVKVMMVEPSKVVPVNQPIANNIQPDYDYPSFTARKQAYYKEHEKDAPASSSELEKFIGENLINKIGILITIIGVGIGTKYAIDHQLINPLTRILLGYLVGFLLFGFAVRLKKDYNNFSAVLMSGAMAIIYFITYAAYSFYALMPLNVTFGLMVLITAFTVYAAIKYDRQVISHIGMVGAYAVPFLLSNGSGNMLVLFAYMSIINLGLMVLAFNKYWKPIYYVSFALSWFIYFTWYDASYNDILHFTNAFFFLAVFYLIFYATYLSYNLIRKEVFDLFDAALILINSFIFYGIGYALLSTHPDGKSYLGLFTLITAMIQALVCLLIYKMKLAEWHLFYYISALGLTFLTIAIPVQLHGNWIPLLWVGEAGFLFWIGRVKQLSVYEVLSYILMILATLSILACWNTGYSFKSVLSSHISIIPVVNIYFLTSVLFVTVFVFINILNRNEKYPFTLKEDDLFHSIMQYVIPGILISSLFFMFWFEISSYCNQQLLALSDNADGIVRDGLNLKHYTDLTQYRILSLLNYSILFFIGLSIFNIKVLKKKTLGYLNLEANLLLLFLFLTQGLLSLSELRDSFLNQTSTDFYHPGAFNFIFRYICYGIVVAMLRVCYQYVQEEVFDYKLDKVFSIIQHTVILWILSSELITWIDFFKSDQAYKLGLSLLWGSYALLLIVLGIWKKKQHLRIGAIVLFSITLLKLFFYDLKDMGTISKTIIFVSLGLLLLIISFLYNKYKDIIWDEPEE